MTNASTVETPSGPGAVRIAGEDAELFLQGQLSNDVTALKAGDRQLTSYSSSQGRVLAVLVLERIEDAFVAMLPAAVLPEFIKRLRLYVLRADVSIDDVSGSLGEAGASLDGEGSELAAIRAGRPQVYPATAGRFVAQMLNLDLLSGISFSKGCYTGQEVIARTQNLGKIKRRMFRFFVPGTDALSAGHGIYSGDSKSGEIVRTAACDGGAETLAVVRLSDLGGCLRAGPDRSAVLERLPLPYAVPENP